MNQFTLAPSRPARSSFHLPFVVPLPRLPWRGDLPPCDAALTLSLLILALLGLPLLYSASYAVSLDLHQHPYQFVRHQALCLLIGGALMGVLSRWDLQHLRQRVPWFFVATVLLLIGVLFLGKRSDHDHFARWLRWGPLSFQPSELAKFAAILMIAYLVSQIGPRVFREWLDWLVLPPIGLVLALVLVEPHLSATLLISTTAAIMLYIAGAKLSEFVKLIGFGFVLLLLLFVATRFFPPARAKFDYQLNRVAVHLGLTPKPDDDQYQPRHSAAALKRGGLLGVGFCKGRGKLGYMPAVQNDFIFAAIGEEWGFFGCVAMLALFCWLIARICHVAYLCNDQFASLVCAGVAALIALQVSANVAVATMLIPTTGVALPFVSAGGSGLVMLLSAMGLVLNASRTSKQRPD